MTDIIIILFGLILCITITSLMCKKYILDREIVNILRRKGQNTTNDPVLKATGGNHLQKEDACDNVESCNSYNEKNSNIITPQPFNINRMF